MMTSFAKMSVLLLVACIVATLSSGGITAAKAEENVQFGSATYPPTPYQIVQARQKGVEPQRLPGLPLNGWLRKPEGEGPFPAIVVMHGCGGTWRWNEVWSDRLTGWGYVVLDVDSFGPRGKASICDKPWSISGEVRALDAHGAKAFLVGVPFVDPARVAVLGMSHGGWATLNAIRRTTTADLALQPFRAAIALYPWCDEPFEVDAPLLILIGELDDWSPSTRCRTFVSRAGSSNEVALKVYPGAYHLFDLPGIDTREEGHVLRYNEQAAENAVQKIAEFLAKHL